MVRPKGIKLPSAIGCYQSSAIYLHCTPGIKDVFSKAAKRLKLTKAEYFRRLLLRDLPRDLLRDIAGDENERRVNLDRWRFHVPGAERVGGQLSDYDLIVLKEGLPNEI